jgi:diacylglycerol kinase family enzyme
MTPGSAFGSLTVIATAPDGRAPSADDLAGLHAALRSQGLPYELALSDAPETTTRLAAEALTAGGRFIVAVGDDAVAGAVVDGFFRDGHPIVDEPVLGLVGWPGRGTDLARSFGLPTSVAGACAHLGGDNAYPFDVMKVTATDPAGERITRYGVNLAEVGLGAELVRLMQPRGARGRTRGRFRAFWGAYRRSRPRPIVVETDRSAFEGTSFNVVVANAQFTAGGLRVSPRSFPGDGVIDALVFVGPRTDAYTLLPRMFRHGDHVPDPNIKELRAKIRVSVTAARPMPVVLDGRMLGTTPVTFQVMPRQILLKI